MNTVPPKIPLVWYAPELSGPYPMRLIPGRGRFRVMRVGLAIYEVEEPRPYRQPESRVSPWYEPHDPLAQYYRMTLCDMVQEKVEDILP